MKENTDFFDFTSEQASFGGPARWQAVKGQIQLSLSTGKIDGLSKASNHHLAMLAYRTHPVGQMLCIPPPLMLDQAQILRVSTEGQSSRMCESCETPQAAESESRPTSFQSLKTARTHR